MANTVGRKGGAPGDYGYPSADRAALVAKAEDVLARLIARHGHARFSEMDPLSMLVDIVLSHRTRNEQTGAAFRALRARYATWADLRDAPTAEVEATIAAVNWPEVKAPRLQAIMRRIAEERGELRLDFLCDLPAEEGAAWLNRLEGVGPKTVACVLLFTCRKPILPVDTHVHRVAIRLGLIGPKVSAATAHDLLGALLPPDPQVVYDFHRALMKHGQEPCSYSHPRCDRCPLTDSCDYFAAQGRAAAPRHHTPPLFVLESDGEARGG